MKTVPVRVNRALFAAARVAGEVHSRSAAQQITYWARLGRALEAAGSASPCTIEQVLTGEKSYDDLDAACQAAVRVVWDGRIAEAIAGLNLADEFRTNCESWSEAAVDGTVVYHTTSSD